MIHGQDFRAINWQPRPLFPQQEVILFSRPLDKVVR
jgi:hypothetical protein